MSASPVVSIVMPTYDRLEFLAAAVESILAQTFQDWELVIADDGSGDAVLDYLGTLERHEQVRVLRLEHSGNAGKARNAGIAAARAPLVAFMDSDDLWAPTKLEMQLAALRAEPQCCWSYTGFVIVDGDDVPFPSEQSRIWTAYSGDIFDEVVRCSAWIATPAVVVSTALLGEVGGFDEQLDCAEDYDLWARLALKSPVAVVDDALVRVRRHRRADDQPQPGMLHAARDESLGKLAGLLHGERRALVNDERGRNALRRAAVYARNGDPRRALATVAKSLPFSWQSPQWWVRASMGSVRACLHALGARRPAR